LNFELKKLQTSRTGKFRFRVNKSVLHLPALKNAIVPKPFVKPKKSLDLIVMIGVYPTEFVRTYYSSQGEGWVVPFHARQSTGRSKSFPVGFIVFTALCWYIAVGLSSVYSILFYFSTGYRYACRKSLKPTYLFISQKDKNCVNTHKRMSDELGYITGDTAVTYNQEFTGQFSKYRAVESFSDTGRFSLITPHGSSAGFHNNHHHNEKLQLSTPGRLPVSKLQPLPASPSSATHKCPEKPFFLSNTTFHCSESNYDMVKASIERALSTLEEYDWSYFPNDCMVRAS
jgi:hypothetical protein